MILGKYFECLRQLEENKIRFNTSIDYRDGYIGDEWDEPTFRPPDDRMITIYMHNPTWNIEFYDDDIIYCYIPEDEKRTPHADSVKDLPASYIIKKIVDFVAKAPKTNIAAAPIKKSHPAQETIFQKIRKYICNED